MISSKELNALGLPNHPNIMPLAMKIINKAIAGGVESVDMLERLGRLLADPRNLLADELLAPLAEAIVEVFPAGILFIPRDEPAPWKKWGDISLEESAVTQMRQAALLPVAVRGALMPDAHTGYGLPIGGANVKAFDGEVLSGKRNIRLPEQEHARNGKPCPHGERIEALPPSMTATTMLS